MEFLINFFSDYGYFAVLFVLIICGFGVPIPEDITLVSGGVISGLGYTNVHIMLVVSLFGVLLGDSTMYWLGRIYGTKILRFRPIRRFLTFVCVWFGANLNNMAIVFYLLPVSYRDYAHRFIWLPA